MHRSTFNLLWTALMLLAVGAACHIATTPTPVPTPTPQFCREFVAIPDPVRPDSNQPYTIYQELIADYLSDGGSPDELERILRNWGLIDSDPNDPYAPDTVSAADDLNGDNYKDIVVAFHYPRTSTTMQPPGQLLVFGCQASVDGVWRYSVLYGIATAPTATTSMPRLICIAPEDNDCISDMNGDRQAEIAFYTEHCTTLACFRVPYIITWNAAAGNFRVLNEQFESLYRYTDENGQGFPNAGFRTRAIGSGLREFIIDEGFIPNRQAGPQRPAIYTWTWRGAEFTQSTVDYLPTPTAAPAGTPTGEPLYRIQLLREADLYLRGGDIEAAIDLYQRILDDQTLPAWGGIVRDEKNAADEENRLNNYTRYRLVLAHAAARDGQDQAMLVIMRQQAAWDTEKPYTYYTRLAEIFLEVFYAPTTTGDPLQAACQAVRAAAAVWSHTWEYLGDRTYFGPSVGTYSLEDLCPF